MLCLHLVLSLEIDTPAEQYQIYEGLGGIIQFGGARPLYERSEAYQRGVPAEQTEIDAYGLVFQQTEGSQGTPRRGTTSIEGIVPHQQQDPQN